MDAVSAPNSTEVGTSLYYLLLVSDHVSWSAADSRPGISLHVELAHHRLVCLPLSGSLSAGALVSRVHRFGHRRCYGSNQVCHGVSSWSRRLPRWATVEATELRRRVPHGRLPAHRCSPLRYHTSVLRAFPLTRRQFHSGSPNELSRGEVEHVERPLSTSDSKLGV